ncbi:MAG: hypothetical protein DMF95_26820 [Acidobacteria bacterium]|nr:MAG: hypothetical protein DMF96_11255 [Acidobacteriota bacterium]PYR17804.1 MAG: hypothetical protein DMF94_22460 [Acidobacteriota bacterium]PYR43052.1 MAG: hypothetical protein DMF95_26820 [Acidobacteriota bacterium]
MAEFDGRRLRRYRPLISPVLSEHSLHFAGTACGVALSDRRSVISIARLLAVLQWLRRRVVSAVPHFADRADAAGKTLGTN